MRSLFLKIHRWLALPFGIFFSILCFTGMLLTFRHEIATLCGVSNDHDLAFFRTIQSLHRYLFMAPANHDGTSIGEVIIGITALCSVLILISGIILWWPKSKTMLKNRLSIHFNKGWRRFVYDSHASLGIYAVIFLLLMALTGPTMSFKWYNNGASTIIGMKSESHDMPTIKSPQQIEKQSSPIIKNAQKSSAPQEAVGNHHEEPGKMGAHKFFMKIHGGQWAGGIFGEIIYFFAALIGGFLPISGYYLWWKRRKAAHSKVTTKS
jgi:uncharacterized iron-regulated membrane protein